MRPFQWEFVDHPENKTTQDMVRRYWEVEDGKFKEKVSDIGKPTEVLRMVKSHSWAWETNCASCEDPVSYVNTRTALSERNDDSAVCGECRDKKQKETNERFKRNESEKEEKQKERMQQALEDGRCESLNAIEFNFFLSLSTHKNFEDARLALGLSEDGAQGHFDKLVERNLVSIKDGYYHILREMRAVLNEIGPQQKAKPIWRSPQAEKIYRVLKSKFGCVFPEVPVCAFVDMSDCEHLLTKDWHKRYFLTCRVDFVVCGYDGIPRFAVEYHGGYHSDEKVKIKDRLKESFLAAAGVPLRAVSARGVVEISQDYLESVK